MRLSSHRLASNSSAWELRCGLCALPHWDERSEIQRRGALRQEGPRLPPGRETLDLQGGPLRVLSLYPLVVPADLGQRCGRFRPTRPRHPSRDPIPSGRRGRRVGLLQAWLCSPVSLVITPPASFAHPQWPFRAPYATSLGKLRITYPVGFLPSSSTVRVRPAGGTATAVFGLNAIGPPLHPSVQTRSQHQYEFGDAPNLEL